MSPADAVSTVRLVPRHRVALLGIIVVFGLLYGRAVGYAFVWDDVDGLVNNPLYEGPWLAGLRASQHDHLDLAYRRLAMARPAHDSYRPALYLSHRIERELFGRSSAAHHASNLVVALLALLLVFALARRVLSDDARALAVTAIFALHPVQVEPIAYVSGRGDLLSACFTTLALLLALRGAERFPTLSAARLVWAGASALAYVVALLCKEAYLGLPLVLAMIAWSRGRVRAQAIEFVAHAVALVGYLGMRVSMARTASEATSLEGALMLPGLWLQYFGIVLAPTDMSVVRPYDEHLRLLGWLALSALGLSAWFIARRPLSPPWRSLRRVVAGLSSALVLIGPSAIVVRIMGVVADRYAYLPLLGFALALVAGFDALTQTFPATRRVASVLASAVFLSWIAFTAVQVPVWRNAQTLYMQAIALEPNSSAAADGLGISYARAGDCHNAAPLFERAVKLNPRDGRAWNNLAVCALGRGDYSRALAAAQHAITFATAPPFRALYNSGLAQLQLGDTAHGCAALRRALAINPSYQRAIELSQRACAATP